MAGRTRTSGRNDTPVNSVNSQQPMCEDADMTRTPPQIPQQGLSPPYTRDSTHLHEPQTNGNDVRMSDTTFAPMFQMPDPAYGTSDSAFSAGLLGPAILSEFLDEMEDEFFYNFGTSSYHYMLKRMQTTPKGKATVHYVWSTLCNSDINRQSSSKDGTTHVGNEGSNGLS